MAETGRMAAWMGFGKGFEIREYPVPEPKPGAVLIKVAIANVCGSDMHYWKGEQDMEKRGRKLPLNTGHEHMGTVHKLGAGVTTDSAGQPLREGDRVIYRYFLPVRALQDVPQAELQVLPHPPGELSVSCEVWPHFQGGYGQYFYLGPNHAIFKLPNEISDEMAAGINCAFTQVYAGARHRRDQGRPDRRDPGRRRPRRLRLRRRPRDGRAQVIVIDGVDERLELASEFGADEFVDLRQYKTPAARIERVKELTERWGGEIVMELVGNPGVVDEGLRMTAPEGTYVEIGNINVGWEASFDPSWIIFGNRRIKGVAHYEAEHLKGALDLMIRTREQYPYDRILSHKFPLDQINEAFRQQEDGHITRGAIVPN